MTPILHSEAVRRYMPHFKSQARRQGRAREGAMGGQASRGAARPNPLYMSPLPSPSSNFTPVRLPPPADARLGLGRPVERRRRQDRCAPPPLPSTAPVACRRSHPWSTFAPLALVPSIPRASAGRLLGVVDAVQVCRGREGEGVFGLRMGGETQCRCAVGGRPPLHLPSPPISTHVHTCVSTPCRPSTRAARASRRCTPRSAARSRCASGGGGGRKGRKAASRHSGTSLLTFLRPLHCTLAHIPLPAPPLHSGWQAATDMRILLEGAGVSPK